MKFESNEKIKNFLSDFDKFLEYLYTRDVTIGKATKYISTKFLFEMNEIMIKWECFYEVGEKLIEGIKYRLNYSDDDEKSFSQRFLIWKEKIKITSEQYEKYITWLYSEVDKRTDAVVGGGYRSSYYKAAVLISGLGETMESHGKLGAKENIIDHYKKIHSRKRAFKSEFEIIK